MKKRALLHASCFLGALFLAGCATKPGVLQPPKPFAAEKGQPVNLDADPHLVGWWKLDDPSGKIAADSSNHGRNGTLVGGLSFDTDSVAGRIGKALKFDGGDDFIQIDGYKGVAGMSPRTSAAWIKTTNPAGEIMSWGSDDGGKMWTFRIVRSGIYVDPKGGYLYTNSKVHDDLWHHVAVVVQEAVRPSLHDNVKLYRDGVLQAIHDIGLLDLYPIDTGTDLDVRIGSGFRGLMDDVRIYDRALSRGEIETLSAGGNAHSR